MSGLPEKYVKTKQGGGVKSHFHEDGDLTVLIVGSPHARAEVKGLQVAAAKAVRGVRGVLTEKDFAEIESVMPPLTSAGEVRFEGQPVAVIIADSFEAASNGRDALRIEYARLPAVLDIEEASRLKSYHGDAVTYAEGAVGAALSEKSELVVLSGQVILPPITRRGEAVPIRAVPDANGGVSVAVETWSAGRLQRELAHWLGLPLAKVTVFPGNDLPATTGSDEFGLAQHVAIAASAALNTGRAVSLSYCPASGSASDELVVLSADYKAGYGAKDGKIKGLRVSMEVDGGPWAGEKVEAVLMDALLSVYGVAAVELSVRCASTNTPPTDAVCEDDSVFGMFVAEEILSAVARESGILGEVLRQRNFAGELVEANPLVSVWRGGLRDAEYAALRKEGEVANEDSRYSKRGLAAIPVRLSTSGDDGQGVDAYEVRLQLHGDGSLRATVPVCSEGMKAFMAGQAADAIGVDREAVVFGNASNSGAVSGFASEETALRAFEEALNRLAEMLRPLAAEVFEKSGVDGLNVDEVEFMAGRVFSRANPDVGFSFGEFASYLDECRVAPVATASLYGSGSKSEVFGVGVSEVRLDGFTGDFQVLRAMLYVGSPEHKKDFQTVERRLKAGFLSALRWMICSKDAALEVLDTPFEFEVEAIGDKSVPAPALCDCFAFGRSFAYSVREALRNAMVASKPEGNPGDLGIPMVPESVFRAMQRKR
ncbi:MAG: molybdopterin cofactor-binding domain-containing protein [Verrucomicrobiota bacterium]